MGDSLQEVISPGGSLPAPPTRRVQYICLRTNLLLASCHKMGDHPSPPGRKGWAATRGCREFIEPLKTQGSRPGRFAGSRGYITRCYRCVTCLYGCITRCCGCVALRYGRVTYYYGRVTFRHDRVALN